MDLLIFFSFSLVDNLPCATKYQNVETQETLYEHGYRLGLSTKDAGEIFLNNHLIMKLYYHKESEYDCDSEDCLKGGLVFVL